MSRSLGSSTLMFLKLCSRAPRTMSFSWLRDSADLDRTIARKPNRAHKSRSILGVRRKDARRETKTGRLNSPSAAPLSEDEHAHDLRRWHPETRETSAATAQEPDNSLAKPVPTPIRAPPRKLPPAACPNRGRKTITINVFGPTYWPISTCVLASELVRPVAKAKSPACVIDR